MTFKPNQLPRLVEGKGFNKKALAFGVIFAATLYSTSSLAQIVNTATVNATPAAGTLTPPSAVESVDLEDAAPNLTITKIADDDTDVTVGQVVNYTYTITNTGNVTATAISIADVHSGTGAAPVPGSETLLTDNGTTGDSTDAGLDGTWDTLAPGDVITFTSAYTVTQADVDAAADITNTATVTATPAAGTFPGAIEAIETVDVEDANPVLTIAKIADDDTDVTLGQTITYTYTITNTGNVSVTGVTINDVHNGSGPAPVPGSETLLTDNGTLGDSTDAATDGSWDTLAPGDVITFESTYVVTQDDIDNLQ